MTTSTIVIRNTELFWAKLDTPVDPFDNGPRWEIQIRTRDKEVRSEWEGHGFKVTLKEDDNGSYYQVNLNRKAFTKKGDQRDPIKCVDAQLMPLEGATIGNGSIGNVQIETYDWEFKGKTGTGFSVKAIQVTKLVEFKRSGGGIEFEIEGETEIVVPTDSSDDDNEW